jgi:hypothetical protein
LLAKATDDGPFRDENIEDLEHAGQKLITAEFANYGDRPTTLTHFDLFTYKNFWNRVRQHRDETLWFPNASVGPLPDVVEPGKIWTGVANQTVMVEKLARERNLICGVSHSHSKRPLTR